MRKHNPRHLRIWIPDPRSVDAFGFIGKEDSMMNVPTFWRALWFLALLTGLTLATVLYMITWSHGTSFKEFGLGRGASLWSGPANDANKTNVTDAIKDEPPRGVHPISHLMSIAVKQFDRISKNEIHTIDQAAAQYRKLRGRHPPPGFDAWYNYAKSHNAIINEKFWDQIYHDLAPFQSLEPVVLRKQAHVFSPRIAIRNGSVEIQSHNSHPKLDKWKDMFSSLSRAPHVNLPDIDIPLSTASEPSMLVPWSTIDTALSLARRMMPQPSNVVNDFSGLGDIETLTEKYDWEPEWLGPRLSYPASHFGPRPMWALIRPACAPKSPARKEKMWSDIWDTRVHTKEEHEAIALLPSDLPEGSFRGYVKNWTHTMTACKHPYIQGLHSAFVSPTDMAVATKLFPLFGDRKFGVSNEILMPGVEEWNVTRSHDQDRFSWHEREDKLYWRGESTHAREPQRFWRRFQRERMVSMMNATEVGVAGKAIEDGDGSTVGVSFAKNFKLLSLNPYNLKVQSGGGLPEWVNGWADAAFTELKCAGESEGQEGCEKYFSTSSYQAENAARAKFAIALDDQSLIKHLRSAKVTLRSSVYRQWYDARLVPWLHYVPLENTLVDLYGVMEFFLGSHIHQTSQSGNGSSSRRSARDDDARLLAEASKDWADKVLRKEDKYIYVYRLLLEYRRVLDDRRDRLGWVEDLK